MSSEPDSDHARPHPDECGGVPCSPRIGHRHRIGRHGDAPAAVHEIGTRALLDSIAIGPGDAPVHLDTLLDDFRQRAFGVLLLAVTLPTFIPLPIGVGAVTGPLIALLGAQMLLGLKHPWLPAFLRRHGPRRDSIRHFRDRLAPWLTRLERFSRPRCETMLDHRAASAFSGLLLVLLGALLALPLPLTNYPFGILLLLFSIALLERDGILMTIAWTLGLAALVASAMLSGQVIDLLRQLFG